VTAVFNVWRNFGKILCAKGSKIEQHGFQPSLAVTLMLLMFLNFLAGKNWIPTPNVQKAVSL